MSPASVRERNRRTREHILPAAVLALAAITSACRATEKLPQYVLDARKPNVTPPHYLVAARSAVNPPATLLLFVHGVFGDTVKSWARPNAPSLPAVILQRPEFANQFDAFAFGFASETLKPGSFHVPEAAAVLASEIAFREFLARYRRFGSSVRSGAETGRTPSGSFVVASL